MQEKEGGKCIKSPIPKKEIEERKERPSRGLAALESNIYLTERQEHVYVDAGGTLGWAFLVSLPAGVIVGLEPLHGLVDSLLEGDELELWEVGAQLGVAGGLLELSVRLGGVKDQLALEVHGLGDGVGNISNGHLILLTNYPSKHTKR